MSTEGEAAVADLKNSATKTEESLTSAMQELAKKIEQARREVAGQNLLPSQIIAQEIEKLETIFNTAKTSVDSANSQLESLGLLCPRLAGSWEISATATQARSLATSAKEYADSVKTENLASTNTWEAASAREFRTAADEHATSADNAAKDAENLAGELESLSNTATTDTAKLITDLATTVNDMAKQAGPLSEIDSAPGASTALDAAREHLSSTQEDGVAKLEGIAEKVSGELASL